MKIFFVTTNKHKFKEVQEVLKDYPIDLEQLDKDYEENHDDGIEVIARNAAKKLAKKLNLPIVLEDTGLFFEAYNGFPGALPKFIFNTLGFEGIFKLLKNKTRQAYFETVAAFCFPGEEPVLFKGIMKGKIAHRIHNQNKNIMPYDKIFIPKGKIKTISEIDLVEKNSFSQRAEAFRKFGKYIISLQNKI